MDHCPPSTPLQGNCPPGSDSMQRLVVHLDLFSGIGGFALAAQMVGGIKTVGFCEIDPWAQQVLAKNFPGTPIHDDVRTLKPNEYGAIDLITGGFPCQPYSRAGARRGNDDSRALWPEMLRIISESKPRWVLGENVPGIIEMALDGCLSDLEAIGYEVGTIEIPACAVNARHRRERVWIVANAQNELRRTEDGCLDRGESQGRGKAESGILREGLRHALDDGLAAAIESRRWNRWQNAASRVCGVADGIPSPMDRNRALGNAIVPQVAAEILRCMMRVDSLHNKVLCESHED
jgi:DNA (cytosine-5)-methyltransferase 1